MLGTPGRAWCNIRVERRQMIEIDCTWRAWQVSWALRMSGHGHDRTATRQKRMASRLLRILASGLIFNATFPFDVLAQNAPAAVAQPATGQPFSTEQLDALVASIALYPDDLLTQLLMASTFPLEVVAAARWVEDPAHKSLSGDALIKALEAQAWDPSVKSLVPFPVVLATLNSNLTWLQQLGYAFTTQQADVFAAVRRRTTSCSRRPSSREHAAGDGRVTCGQQPAPDAAGGDRHPAGAVEH